LDSICHSTAAASRLWHRLIGDWGSHSGTRQLKRVVRPASSVSTRTRCLFTFPDELTIKYQFAARENTPPVTVYWYHKPNGDAYRRPE
jgi:hypothetical protein